MRLLLARHGATPNNLERRYTGQADVPLSPLGQRQAEALAELLAGEPLDVIVSSDLVRAQQTAEAIVRRNDVPLQLDPDLREVAMGEWEGLSHAEIAERYPDELARWQTEPEIFAPPGGETVLQLRDRAVRAFDRWYAEYPTGTVLWVTHGGIIGVLLCHALRIELSHRWQFRRDNTGLSELDVGADYAILMLLNETSHLRGLPDGEQSQVM